MSIHDICEMDLTSTMCVRVEPPHPEYAADVLGSPICCIESRDNSDGTYTLTYSLSKA